MSTESTTTTTSSESSSQSGESSGVGTQSSNTQAEATQHGESGSENSSQESGVETEKSTEADLAALGESDKLNVNEMIVKQLQGQEFTEKDIAKLEKAGLSVEQISMLADAHKQVQLKNNNEIYEAVGGKEVYDGLKEFASEHLDDYEAEAINSALRSGNMRLAKLAVLGLKALAEQENGVRPAKRITSTGVTSSSADGAYTDQQELIKDLNNRKYGKDPEFTDRVNARRNKSGF